MAEMTTAVLLYSLTDEEKSDRLPGVQAPEVDSVTGP